MITKLTFRWAVGLVAVIAMVALLFGVNSDRPGLTAGPAQTPPATPQAPDVQLGNPTNLTAAPGGNPGDVALRWNPADNATFHLVYLVQVGSASGHYHLASGGDAGAATVSGLQFGQPYWFIVVAGRPGDGGAPFQWSQWSNWIKATPVSPVLPTPPSVPGATIEPTQEAVCCGNAEIEGIVIAVDTVANTFTVRVVEYEHFRGNRPANPMTVDYSSVEFVEIWLRSGLYVEAEGSYDPANGILRAYEVERDNRDDDDDDDDDDD